MVLEGFEDLKPAKVIGWDPTTGRVHALCVNGDSPVVKEFEMFISAQGRAHYKEYIADNTNDQTPLTDDEREERLARRWQGIDQQ